jgi:hypothetical protein
MPKKRSWFSLPAVHLEPCIVEVCLWLGRHRNALIMMQNMMRNNTTLSGVSFLV